MSTVERRAAFAEHAYNLSELGWPLIRADGKSPFEKGWPKTSTVDPDTAASLWVNWGLDYNMGVVLSGANLAVLEYDREEARSQFFALLGGDFPLTPTCVTGSAKHHVYFRDPGGLRKATRDGLELRVGAHQCLIPPSEHPETGRPYKWLQGYEPWEVEPLLLPEHIRAFFEEERDLPQVEALAPSRGADLPQVEGSWGKRFVDARSALAIAALLRLDFPRARCPLHEDARPSGSFFEGARGWLYHCHAGCGSTSLPGLWLRAKYGVHPSWITRAEFSVWCRRLSVELGESAVADTLPTLPATFPPSVRRYWDGYRLRVVCDRLSGYDDTWPLFTHAFAARWCGLPRSTARVARTTLMKAGWLATTGEVVRVGGFKEAHRWCPGPRALQVMEAA